MIIEFIKKDYLIKKNPDINDDYYFYESYIEYLSSKKIDNSIEYLKIDYLDRGVKNWHNFGLLLKKKIPNLKLLKFEQNYYFNLNKDDKWKTAELFFINMNLNYLSIDWFQCFGDIINDKKYDNISDDDDIFNDLINKQLIDKNDYIIKFSKSIHED
jgi:hypothetical protein